MSHLKYALRTLGRSPGFTCMAVLTLAISIGANTTIFSLLDALLWRPLEVKDSHRLVALLNHDENGATRPFSIEMLARLQERQQVFADLAGWFAPSVTVDWGSEAERVGALQLTGDTFTAMGVQPYLGRGLTPQDDHPNAAPVAILTHHYWERRFGKDAGVIGRTVLIADMPVTVVGVSAPGFSGFQPGLPCEILTPLSVHYWSHMPWDDPSFLWVQVFGHLKPGVSTEQAKAQLDVVWPQILAEVMPAGQSADPRRGSLANSVTVEPATTGRTFLRDRFEEPLRVLMAVVGLMLLIACVNTAALLLVRTVARHKEVAVSIALGAGSWHVVGQLLT